MLYCLYSTTYNESQQIYIFHCIFKWYVNLWANMCMSVGVCCANSDSWPESWDQEGLGQGFPLVYFNIGLRYPEVRETWEWGLLRNTWLHKSLSGRLPLCQNFRPDRNFNHYISLRPHEPCKQGARSTSVSASDGHHRRCQYPSGVRCSWLKFPKNTHNQTGAVLDGATFPYFSWDEGATFWIKIWSN